MESAGMETVQVRSRLVGGVLFEYVPGQRVVRIRRRGLMFEVSLDQLVEASDAGRAVLRADAITAAWIAAAPSRPDYIRDGHDI